MDISAVIKQCEDYLFPKLLMTVRERSLYYHMLRHTRLIGKETALFAIFPLSKALGIAESSVRESVRTMNDKGCIEISRSRKGHRIKVHLPEEIQGLLPEERPPAPIDIESVDFFTGRTYLDALLSRENDRCFYCLKAINSDNCELDHLVANAIGGNNSYRNIVASCHECNSTKQDMSAADFCRLLYRKGILSQQELEDRLGTIDQLQSGKLKPDV